jgi:putative flavoprotein involved in K+ transport
VQRTDTLIVGAGQAGLAVSNLLTAAGRDHVLLERGRVGERWRSQGWDSLRLLTPNWMTRLPGWSYTGNDPDGFMARTEVVDFFDRYARSFGAPVQGETRVERVHALGDGYRVVTDQGTWSARNVVVATGATDTPHVPDFGRALASDVEQITPSTYRSPESLRRGGVLVVGASATGVQLADELARSGRHVILAVGRHTRGVRRYRGIDIFRWLEATGKNDTPLACLSDPEAAPRMPSLQVVGGVPAVDVDLRSLQDRGVVLTGRCIEAGDTRLRFADDLPDTTHAADSALERLLRDFDDHAARSGWTHLEPAGPVTRVRMPMRRITRLDLRDAGIETVVWATGYRRDYSWLDVPVLDRRGEIVQSAGVTDAPGLYVVGLRFQTRRNSNFIDGVRHDARAVVDHLVSRRRDCVPVAV